MAQSQLPKLNKHEPNPFRPDIPEDFRGISPNLYGFLRETAETLREQHNLSQAGDSTYSWEILTQVDLTHRFNVGAVGKFYHPNYGIIHARYCRFGEMLDTEDLGAPLGLVASSGQVAWRVTNDFSKSAADLVIGVGGFYVLPPLDSYGWVIVNGPNIQSLTSGQESAPQLFQKFVWQDSLLASPDAETAGTIFGALLGIADLVESEPDQWEIPAGKLFVDQLGDSEKRIRDWIEVAVNEALARVSSLEDQVSLLLGSGGIGGLTIRIAAAEGTIKEHTALITRANELNIQNFATLNDRVTILEQRGTGGGGSTGGIRADLNNLIDSYNTYVGLNNGRVDTLRTQMDGVLSITATLPGQFNAIYTRLNGLDDRVTNLKLSELADVPDSYIGQANKFLQILGDESAATFTALTAGIIAFTPTGGLSSTDVQSALNELDTEKARLDGAAFSGTVTVPDLAYNSGTWDSSAAVPTRNAIRNELEGTIRPALLPAGGASAYTLQKTSGSDYAVTWSAVTAGAVSFTPAGNVSATTVQVAIQELDSEKVSKAGDTMTGQLTVPGLKLTDVTPFFRIESTVWGDSVYFQAGVTDGGSSGGNNMMILLPSSKKLAINFGLTIPFYVLSTGAYVMSDPYAAAWGASLKIPSQGDIYAALSGGLAGVLTHATDANLSHTHSTSKRTVILSGTITANRTLTLNTSGALEGSRVRITRTGAGAFVWDVGTGPLKALGVGTWCDVEYDGSAWMLVAYGSL